MIIQCLKNNLWWLQCNINYDVKSFVVIFSLPRCLCCFFFFKRLIKANLIIFHFFPPISQDTILSYLQTFIPMNYFSNHHLASTPTEIIRFCFPRKLDVPWCEVTSTKYLQFRGAYKNMPIEHSFHFFGNVQCNWVHKLPATGALPLKKKKKKFHSCCWAPKGWIRESSGRNWQTRESDISNY